MTYIIVKDKQTIIGEPFESYFSALKEATRLFGDNPKDWMRLNARVEENRPLRR